MNVHQGDPLAPHAGDLPGAPDLTSTSGAFSLHLDRLYDSDLHSLSSPSSPRSNISGGSTGDVSTKPVKRPRSAKPLSPKLAKALPPLSSIPLPIKLSGPVKIPSNASSRTNSKTVVTSKHTLEIQFINKNKRYVQMRNELLEKQKPVLDLYQNLLQIKKQLEKHHKTVQLDDIKLLSYHDYNNRLNSYGGGESLSPQVVAGMKSSLEDIPKTLIDVCQNLLSRRALIVDLLESITKSEVDLSEVSGRIESLKTEGQMLQNSLDAIIEEHQTKINELVTKWRMLLNAKNNNAKADELELKLRAQEKLTYESAHVIRELQKKLDDRKISYDKSMGELTGLVNSLKEQVKKLEHDLESERKATGDIRSRNHSNSQNIKTMRAKLTELENAKRETDAANQELQKKLRQLQDQNRHKETQWTKEKEELSRMLKRQDSMLQTHKTQYESTLKTIESEKTTTEIQMQNEIDTLSSNLVSIKIQLENVITERDEAVHKCAAFEGYLARMGEDSKLEMQKLSSSICWGKQRASTTTEEDQYIDNMSKDLKIRELEDKIRKMEKERVYHEEEEQRQKEENCPTETDRQLSKQQECISKYKMLLEESEAKLTEKSTEVAALRAEMKQLKVRQEALEEQNVKCPTDELQRMIEEGRGKLSDLMRKSIDSEQKIEYYTLVVEKQGHQISEMENLLRYRENMAGVLKASRDELLMEKESLTKYSQELRLVLTELTKEGKMKERLIKELHEKVDMRETQISKLEKEVRELEENLMSANQKRFMLQETIGTMEKELQSTKAHVNQLADINSRNIRPKMVKRF
ncbi:golgin subfamily A member 6-like protein 7 [Anthonomus grandis grandis]|uniref:golgin subfamily A member 6-like protein 7 n=1 Tax=Anthonomus grandis grandis TaxID=2921223 RepID=UPI00216600FB|nr:golgin subfamily A member 6-like protein 7 [Anthonomus grandis grandis]